MRAPRTFALGLAAAATLTSGATQGPPHGLALGVVGGRKVVLRCEPYPQGSHPLPGPACAALAQAGGDLDALPGEPAVCHQPYAPVHVTADGHYGARPVHWRKKFANRCILHAATGPLFPF
jgi:hypothetical protein